MVGRERASLQRCGRDEVFARGREEWFRVRRKEHLLDMIVSDSELQQAKQIWVLFASKRSVTKEKIVHTAVRKLFSRIFNTMAR